MIITIPIHSTSTNLSIEFCAAGILQKMKEGAENVEKKLQAKVESMKNANEGKGK